MKNSDSQVVTAILCGLVFAVTCCLASDFRNNPVPFGITLALGNGITFFLAYQAGKYYSK